MSEGTLCYFIICIQAFTVHYSITLFSEWHTSLKRLFTLFSILVMSSSSGLMKSGILEEKVSWFSGTHQPGWFLGSAKPHNQDIL